MSGCVAVHLARSACGAARRLLSGRRGRRVGAQARCVPQAEREWPPTPFAVCRSSWRSLSKLESFGSSMLTAPFGKCSSPSCLTTAVIRSNAAGDAVMPCFAHRAFRSHSPSPSSSSLAAATVWMVCDPLSSFWSATSLMRSASFICAGSGGSTSFEEDALYGRTLAAGADDISFSLGSFSFSLTLLTLTFSAAATRAGTGCAPSPRSRHVCARWAPWQARHSPFALDVRPIERSLTERESGFAYCTCAECRSESGNWCGSQFNFHPAPSAMQERCVPWGSRGTFF